MEVRQMFRYVVIVMLAISVFITSVHTAQGRELVVYSARKEHLIRPLFQAYKKETGVTVSYITGKAPALMQRIKAEGNRTSADLFLTVDAGTLWRAAQLGILRPVDSDLLKQNIPAHLRDPENRWFGLSLRARTIVYSTERVKPDELSTYADLAHPRWKNRLVLRTSKKVYNQSLVAMFIKEQGEAETEKTIQGWVRNLAAPPFSSDTQVLKAIHAGQGDVGVVNTYYFGRIQKKNPDIPLALFWPNQMSTGVHVNISGAGVTAQTRNPDLAVAFLEWLSTEAAQRQFADANLEYPANPRVPQHPLTAAWGRFKQDPANLVNAGINQARAVQLMDRAGYR
jgi:iron(III) transport system substrate-binding protein